ncbi:MAG TPA: hypothetical protein PLI62_00735 [Spirochaetota bacterium]|nr:hypothetical protein [Spirochaetota bacterium]HQP48114.1 hypothetical protein [Spirochaetota bacterium]
MEEKIRTLAFLCCFATITLVSCTAGRNSTATDARITALGSLLIEFETDVRAVCQSRSWTAERANWIRAVQNAKTIRSMGACLLACENSILDICLMQHWESERPSWQSKVKNASRIEELRDCLLYMEESIKFDSAIMTWFRKRESWKRRVSAL